MKTFLNTLQGKIIAGLTIIALVMGILVEGIQIQTAYYTMIVRKTESIQANSVLRNAHGFVTVEQATQSANQYPLIRAKLKQLNPDVSDADMDRRAMNVCIHRYGANNCSLQP